MRNLSRRTKVYWKEYEHWACGRHLPALVLPAGIEQCWLCSNKRPPMADRPPMPEGYEPNKPRTKKANNPPKRSVPRRKPSELDAMLTGSVAANLDQEIEPKPSLRSVGVPAAKPAPVANAPAKPAAAASKVAPTLLSGGTKCAWPDCQEHARPRSKYCSRNCSNKNARARHKSRSK